MPWIAGATRVLCQKKCPIWRLVRGLVGPTVPQCHLKCNPKSFKKNEIGKNSHLLNRAALGLLLSGQKRTKHSDTISFEGRPIFNLRKTYTIVFQNLERTKVMLICLWVELSSSPELRLKLAIYQVLNTGNTFEAKVQKFCTYFSCQPGPGPGE